MFSIANPIALRKNTGLLVFRNLWLPFRSWKDFTGKLLVWREDETCRHSTFLYSLTIGAVEAFHLSSSCWNIRPLGLITRSSTVYLYFSSNQNQSMCHGYIFSPESCRCSIIYTDILCANAVIDKFITSKGIQFSFQSCGGMNSAASSVANNKAPLPKLGSASPVLPGGKCVWPPAASSHRWGSNFAVRQMSFCSGTAGVIHADAASYCL